MYDNILVQARKAFGSTTSKHLINFILLMSFPFLKAEDVLCLEENMGVRTLFLL